MTSQFDPLYAAYEASATEMPVREHIEAYTFLTALVDLTNLAVLDLGCGTGVYTRRLAAAGAARVTGLDVAEGMITEARRREAEQPLGIEYRLHDTSVLSGADPDLVGQFDLVTAIYMLPYATTVDELTAMCRTAHAALRPTGGRFLTYALRACWQRV